MRSIEVFATLIAVPSNCMMNSNSSVSSSSFSSLIVLLSCSLRMLTQSLSLKYGRNLLILSGLIECVLVFFMVKFPP